MVGSRISPEVNCFIAWQQLVVKNNLRIQEDREYTKNKPIMGSGMGVPLHGLVSSPLLIWSNTNLPNEKNSKLKSYYSRFLSNEHMSLDEL